MQQGTQHGMITAIYRVSGDRASIAARAQAIATEQSVEMPLSAIDDPFVLERVVGQVLGIDELREGLFELRIGLSAATTGHEAGQLMNMLFGNSSIHDDIVLWDVDLPAEVMAAFTGPNVGLEGLRRRVGVTDRALTCSALKPQGLPPARLAGLAHGMARGGLDFIKDDHGLADQGYSRFADRVRACADAVGDACAATGGRTRYAPNVSGHLDQLREQVALAEAVGLDTVLIAPMIVGLPAFQALVREFPGMAFMTHPAMAGAARIAPPLLIGKLFRLFGADATVFPNHGGRFGYSTDTCRALAGAALDDWHGLKSCVPVPAGGMTPERVPDMLDFYGRDVMLLIGGGLLAARERLAEESAAFLDLVRAHGR
jgi:ribulose-bisphosphate carboxylase large chain